MKKTISEVMKNSKSKLNFLDLTCQSKEMKVLLSAFERVLRTGIFVLGKEVKNFEKSFAMYLGVKHCIGVANGLEALQIALMAEGIGFGDEVITTPISAAATTLAILAVGAKPVFIDTLDNGLINPDLIAPVITKKTKAILPVYLYGNPADLSSLQKICRKYKLSLIEDAAQAHGSKYKNKYLGTFGNLGCFSFYPTKNLGALGDGGAIVTNNSNLAKKCFEIRDYGQKSKYNHCRFGLNSRLDELQAAFLSIRLKRLDQDNNIRAKFAQRYISNLSQIKEIKIIKPMPDGQGNFHLFAVKTKRRNQLQEYLRKKGIETAIHYPLIIPDQLFIKDEYKGFSFPVARNFVNTCLSLPCHPKMDLKDVQFICAQIKQFFR